MRSRLLKVLLLAVLILVAGFAVLLLAAKPYMVPTDSMRPTLLTGDCVFVTNSLGTLRRGDIAWFHPPAGPNSSNVFVKRIIGVSGDRIRIVAGSMDSWNFRFVPAENLVGKPLFRYWSVDQARNTGWNRTLRLVR